MKLQEYYEKIRKHALTMKQYGFDGIECLYTPNKRLGRPPCFIGILLPHAVRVRCDDNQLRADQIADEGILIAEDASPYKLGVFLCRVQTIHDTQAIGSPLNVVTDQHRAQMITALDAYAIDQGLKLAVV